MIFKVNDELTVQFRFKHYHIPTQKKSKINNIWKATVAEMIDPETGLQIAAARSTCSPRDNFCKDTGRKVALQRLFKVTNETFTKEVRTRFWKEYLKWTNNKVMKGE